MFMKINNTNSGFNSMLKKREIVPWAVNTNKVNIYKFILQVR
jgi:hypothetical protein